jgi:ATP synthase protein I
MSDTIARGSAFDVAPDPAPWQALSAAQAQELRERDPSISPWRVVAAQAVAGLVCVAVVWAVTQHTSAAWSALYGAAATVFPGALLARGMTRGRTRGTSGPVATAAGFMFWEMLKVGVAIAMLVIAARVVADLSWPALLATMVVCIKVNWVALLWRPGRLNNKASNRHGS